MSEFYTCIEQYGNRILYRGYKNGVEISEEIEYEPHVFMPSKEPTEFKAYSDKNLSLKKKKFSSISDFREFVDRYKEVENFKVYGCSDIIRQYTAERFSGPISWDFSHLKVWYFDIETKAENGFPSPEQADQDMLLVTMMEKTEKIMRVWSRRPIKADNPIYKEPYQVDFRLFEDEREFLMDFVKFLGSERIDVLTGWNSESFDIPYIVNRVKNVLGESFVKLLSPWRVVKPRRVKGQNDEMYTTFDLYGITHLDALDLYKKFNPGSKESFALDNIAFEELGKRKVAIPVDTFKESYQPEHWEQFVHYCCVDTHLVYEIDYKMCHTRLATQLAMHAKCGLNDVVSAMRLWESIIFNHFKSLNIIEDFSKARNERTSIEGAYVHEPVPGKYGWTVSVDAEALYPSMMVQHNISPETMVRMIDGINVEYLLSGKVPELGENECISANGLVTRTDEIGFVPFLVKQLGDLRKSIKKEMLALKQVEQDVIAERDRNGSTPEIEERLVSLFNDIAAKDIAQKGVKVAMNSFYGALALPYFKYYDYRLAEAITLNGQMMLKTAMKLTNSLTRSLGYTGKNESVTYSDTDSLYLDVQFLVDKKWKSESPEAIVNHLEDFVIKGIQPFLDKKFSNLIQSLKCMERKIFFKLECIGPSILFVAKKRYAFDILYSEGVRYNSPKIKVIGLEIVRSSTPAKVKEYLKKGLEVIMREDESKLHEYVAKTKKEFMSLDYQSISFPRSCNGLKVYHSASSIYGPKTPAQVRGALLHNHHLKRKGLEKDFDLIKDGEKIKFVYLKMPNPIHENVISYIGKIPDAFGLVPFVNYHEQWAKSFIAPIKNLLDPIGWTHEEILTFDV